MINFDKVTALIRERTNDISHAATELYIFPVVSFCFARPTALCQTVFPPFVNQAYESFKRVEGAPELASLLLP